MSSLENLHEIIQTYLPKYLTPSQTQQLYSELLKFPDNFDFYLQHSEFDEELLQGDGWKGFVLIDFKTKNEKRVSGVILSNSCDISPENERDFPTNILFSPIIPLKKYKKLLQTIKNEEQVENILINLRKQRNTAIFYLPYCENIIEESIILLDNIHTHPLSDFQSKTPQKIFTLTQYAFYVFLIKLSIHFSRFQEEVVRF